MDTEESECERLLHERDPAALPKIIERFHRPLYSFLCHQTGDRSVAEDLLQEVFVRALQAKDRFQARGRLSGWLFTIARRLALDYMEKKSRRKTEALETAEEMPGRPREFAESSPGPEAVFEGEVSRIRIEAAIAALPEQQREVFLMREYGGLSFSQIASAVGCPLGTALARMRYALLKLRKSLEDFDAQPRI